MLETLKIRNLAVIDRAEVEFKSGLNVLSGETGAGKSIVLSAISLILGGRASSDLIRKGCDEAVVEALFDLRELPWVKDRLNRLGFEPSQDLLIKRTVTQNGRNRVYVNGELATLGILSDLCEDLVDLCGQHEHQSLLKRDAQLLLLDHYGGLLEQSESVSQFFGRVRSLKSELEAIQTAEEERMRKLDFLRFQIKELDDASLEAEEDEALKEEKKLLQTTELRVQAAQQVQEILDHNEGLLDRLRTVQQKLKSLEDWDKDSGNLRSTSDRAFAEIEELSLAVNRYVESVQFDSGRLGEVQERLSLISQLKRKYGSTVIEMLERLKKLREEAASLESTSEKRAKLQSELEELEAELYKKGKDLSQARKNISKVFSDSVTAELQELSMPEAVFGASLESSDEIQDWTVKGGADHIDFSVQTNRGEESKALSKIVSGGELSRLMLAIRRVISDKGQIGVYLFDEIDAGIGGKTAFQVGKKLKSVSKSNQVVCITHLPQVACFADHHLVVKKRSIGNRTVTEVTPLEIKRRREEIARMLGGARMTPTSLKNANELLKTAKNAAV